MVSKVPNEKINKDDSGSEAQVDLEISGISGCNSSAKVDNSTVEGRISSFTDKCRQAGLKVTPQRLEIFKALVTSDEHPTAEVVCTQVRKTMPHISLDTVNRTLLTLSEIGAAFIVEGTGQARRFDANFDAHQHFRCIKCRRIIDFYHEPFNEVMVPDQLSDRYEVLRKTVYFEGYCDRCKDSE